MLTDDPALNSFVEESVEEWAEVIGLDEKLRTLREAAASAASASSVMVNNPGLEPSQARPRVVRGRPVHRPDLAVRNQPAVVGRDPYDAAGNPLSYRRLRYHPGDLIWGANPLEYDDIPARAVFHYFKPSRPGQRRGVPEFASALSNWPELRRYCNAVIAAAETAADYAMTIESTAPPEEPADDIDSSPNADGAMDTVELKKRMATILPKGWKMSQTKAEQPTTTYPSFVDKKVAEAARCLNMPFTIAALDSSNSNLSARYLDSQIYAKAIKIDRKKLQRLLNRLLDAWLTEAIRIPGFLPSTPDRFPHKWYWPSIGEHADPDKVASGQGARLRNGTTCLQDECADGGNDWEVVQEKIAASLGLTVDEYRKQILIPNMLANPAPPPPAAAMTPAKPAGGGGGAKPTDQQQQQEP
jgi:capsid protein